MDTKRVNWNDFRILLELGRNNTLSSAARQLGVDDSTVSRRVAQLEYALGETLFARDHLGFHLTARGKELLEYVQDMERGALAIIESVKKTHQGPAGKVRIATMEGIASLYLAAELVELQSKCPLLQVELVTSANHVYVNRREADIFLSFFPLEGRGLDVTSLGKFRLHLYASLPYLKRFGTPLRTEELESHSFVSYVEDLIQLDAVRWLDEGVPDATVVFRSTSMLSQMFAAAAGAGIVMLPEFARPERFGLIQILSNQIEVSRTIWLTVHRDLQYAERIKAVVSFLRGTLQRDYPVS
ncbi:MAG TPA: LysR family transcriptional regulator [Noviherbaspirillum sp.]|nr:LysR family transcriptional regulator [Noviherbaspirillum sp.]